MSKQGTPEAGKQTPWDSAFREGYAKGLEQSQGIPYRQAWLEAPEVTQNKAGEWVPAIPLPFYGLRKRCGCGRRFWTATGYRGHYALLHVMHLD